MKILLISYYFPPYNTVGAVRPGKLARYLQKKGHTVVVISAQKPPFPLGLPLEITPEHVHEVHGMSANAPIYWLLGGYKKTTTTGFQEIGKNRPWLRQLGKLYKTLFHWPDAESAWGKAAITQGNKLLANNDFDLIYVSAPSFSALKAGRKLASTYKLPWIAEYRDLWSDNHAYPHPAWRRIFERHWEKNLMRSASALVTVSPPLAQKLAHHDKPVWVIQNGYDPEDFAQIPTSVPSQREELRIVYTGNIYQEYYDTDTFCSGLAQFVTQGGFAKIHVIGRNISPIIASATKYGVLHLFDISGTQPRPQALGLQQTADVLLMFLWRDGEDGIYTTKLFEYAGANRPILAIGSNDSDVANIINESSIGYVASDASSVAAQLAIWQTEKNKSGAVKVTPTGNKDFTRDAQFALLEKNIENLLMASKNWQND